MSKSNGKKNVAVLTVLIALIIFMPCLIISTTNIDFAQAYATIPAGTIDNIFNSENEAFVKDNLDKLAAKAGYKDLDAMINGVINGDVKDSTGFATDTTVKLGTYYNLSTGKYEDLVWIPVYLAKDKVGKSAVLTLWLASIDPTEQASNQERSTWTDGTYTRDYTVKQDGMVCNSYDGSYIRNVTLNNGSSYLGNWGTGTAVTPPNYTYPTTDKTKNKFVDFTTGELSGFIVSPSEMTWQMDEHLSPNDPSWAGHITSPSDTDKILECYPISWTQDKVWLPSVNEMTNMLGFGYYSVWQCTNEQKRTGKLSSEYSTDNYVLLRSGAQVQSSVGYYGIVDCNGSVPSDDLGRGDWKGIVRPAIHLNLSAAADAVGIDEPQNVSIEYTGEQLDFSSLTSMPDWYLSDKMTVAFSDGSTGKVDADEYEMIVTIKEKYALAGLKFKGTPDADESEISRKFKFSITEKKIGVDLSLDDNNRPQLKPKSGAVFSGDTEENGRAPTFGFKYVNKVSGKEYDDYPEGEVGTYEAIVSILNDCNYVLDKSYSIDVEIKRSKVNKPSMAIVEQAYSGSELKFNVSQVTDKVTITPPAGMTYKDGVLTAKNAGTYDVRISLADNGKSTCWNVSGDTEDISAYTITVKIKSVKLDTQITCSDADLSWEVGDQVTFTISDGRYSGDSIDYYVYYLKSGDSTKYDAIDANKIVEGDNVKVDIPNSLGIGSYTFVVELRKNSTSSDNGNYYIDGDSKTATFSIVGNGITVTANNIKWKVNNVDIGDLTNGKLPLTYSGSAFRFSVDESNLKALGVKIDTSKGTRGLEGDIEQTNVGASYSVKVWLCNYDNTYDTYSGSYTLNYEIQQAKYDMSKVKWDYTDGALKYNANYQTVTLTGLPSTLTVINDGYEGNRYRNAGEGYVASVLGFNNTDSNYMTPLYNKPETYEGDFDWTLTWSIGKATLTLEWESVDTQDSAGNAFRLPKVKGENAQFVDSNKYRYYKSSGVSVGDEINLEDILVGESAVRYWVEAVLTDNAAVNYEISEATKRISFKVGMDGEKITVDLEAQSFTYDGNAHGGELRVIEGTMKLERIIKTYYRGSVSESNRLDGAPTDAGDYIVVLSLSEADEEDFALTRTQITFSIAKAKITAKWDTSGQTPEIANLSESQKAVVGYIYYDSEGNELPDGAQLEAGKTYSVKAILTGDNAKNYEFVSEEGEVLPNETETEVKDFTIGSNGGSGNVIGGVDSGNDPSGNNPGGDGGALDEILEKLKEMPLWQLIAGIISIILTIIFLSKTASYDSKRRKYNKKAEKLDTSMYAGAYLGVAMTIWTAIACVLMGLAVISLVMMLIAKSRCNKAEEEYEEAKEEYARNREEMMFIR
ncbi:MAG: hypothetical protein K2K85_02825, partial [Clostridia bacterium]|nr:hypothetical protein [Clostridia bacterium]